MMWAGNALTTSRCILPHIIEGHIFHLAGGRDGRRIRSHLNGLLAAVFPIHFGAMNAHTSSTA